jgi:hypothetical protein
LIRLVNQDQFYAVSESEAARKKSTASTCLPSERLLIEIDLNRLFSEEEMAAIEGLNS